MKCPNDGATLIMSERSGVEIDYCPECRGVWLDRGELDKIIDRAGSSPAPAATGSSGGAYPPPGQGGAYPDMPYGTGYADPRQQHGYGRPKKRENWLSELFD
ncbi:zf-TFIIB domain-containing protein [Naasia sp. SYSU D00948]|uniref:TFIIB-type zinc ribbon-containing protein n=1 Tax=Naasia sp. SYSU D00948 TaxID=2817379 RepID=UPI001B307DBA|nr:zf-TFIIB domain-containing protein [Naasia sp. SYSU D00948]